MSYIYIYIYIYSYTYIHNSCIHMHESIHEHNIRHMLSNIYFLGTYRVFYPKAAHYDLRCPQFEGK